MTKKIISIPPNYFFLCIIVSIALFFACKQFNIIEFPLNIIFGMPLLILGIYLIIISHFLLEKNNTPEKFQKTTYLVKGGIYKYSRNPMYLGFVILLFGISFVLGNLISFISPVFFFVVINWMFIPYEEEKMKVEIGLEYLEYIKKVRRWI